MLKELSTKTNLAKVGEEIGLELGKEMVKSYQEANPTDVKSYMVGREIIEKILAQPGCVGIKLFNAYNELGSKTLVYVGVGLDGNAIVQYSIVNNEGLLANREAIVADRVKTDDRDNFGWWIFD
jgi:hypothetical protein